MLCDDHWVFTRRLQQFANLDSVFPIVARVASRADAIPVRAEITHLPPNFAPRPRGRNSRHRNGEVAPVLLRCRCRVASPITTRARISGHPAVATFYGVNVKHAFQVLRCGQDWFVWKHFAANIKKNRLHHLPMSKGVGRARLLSFHSGRPRDLRPTPLLMFSSDQLQNGLARLFANQQVICPQKRTGKPCQEVGPVRSRLDDCQSVCCGA